jgi:hypothetical protein
MRINHMLTTPHKPPVAASTPAQRGDALVARVLPFAHWFAAARGSPPAHAEAIAPLDGEYHAPADVLGLQAPADFLWLWLRTGEPAYADLYRGICLSELATAPPDATLEWRARTELLLGAVDQRHTLSAARRATRRGPRRPPGGARRASGGAAPLPGRLPL